MWAAAVWAAAGRLQEWATRRQKWLGNTDWPIIAMNTVFNYGKNRRGFKNILRMEFGETNGLVIIPSAILTTSLWVRTDDLSGNMVELEEVLFRHKI
jgi:hypothetical protein